MAGGSDLQNTSPGEGGLQWLSKIRARHFLIREHSHLVNKDFVSGCPDRFEFGTSEKISLKEAVNVIASCFRHPFSEPRESRLVDDLNHPSLLDGTHSSEKRNIILLGHDTKTDIQYMKSIGFDAPALSCVVEILDTSELHRAMLHEDQASSLGTILAELGFAAWNLHNAVGLVLKFMETIADSRNNRATMRDTRCKLLLGSVFVLSL